MRRCSPRFQIDSKASRAAGSLATLMAAVIFTPVLARWSARSTSLMDRSEMAAASSTRQQVGRTRGPLRLRSARLPSRLAFTMDRAIW